MKCLVSRSGTPALVDCDTISPQQCKLFVDYSEEHKQATVRLGFSIIDPDSDKHEFTLVYNADNLMPGETFLKSAATNLPQDQLAYLERGGKSELKILSLAARDPCPIKCPATRITPRNDFGHRFQQFSELAKATRICVLFDYKWVGERKQLFEQVMSSLGELKGILVRNNAKPHEIVCWQDLNVNDYVVADTPPPYTDASNVCLDKFAAGSTTASLSSERPPHSPPVFPASPTEKATTISSRSPRLLSSPVPDISISHGISDGAVACLENLLEKFSVNVVEHIDYLLESADDECRHMLQEHDYEVQVVMEDNIAEIKRTFDHMLDQCTEDAMQIAQELEERVEDTIAKLEWTLKEKLANFNGCVTDGIREVEKLVKTYAEELRRRQRCLKQKTCSELERTCSERERMCSERERMCSEREKMCSERERICLEREKKCLELGWAHLEREKERLKQKKLSLKQKKLSLKQKKLSLKQKKLSLKQKRLALKQELLLSNQ